MRWPLYFILAYVAVGLQIGLASALRVGGASPNFVLIVAVFIALNAAREPALLGCLVLGLMQDLVTAQRLGLLGLSYGLFALLVAGRGNLSLRQNIIVQFSFALLGGLITAMVLLLHGWLPFVHGVRLSVGPTLWSALYSAMLAPPLLWPLTRVRRLFSFATPRRRLG